MAQSQIQKTKTACSTSNNGGLSIMVDNVNNWLEHGDWEPLAYLLKNHREKATLKRIFRYVFDKHVDYVEGKEAKGSKWGAVVTYNKKANTKLKLNSKGESIHFDDLAMLAAKGFGRLGKIEVKGKQVNAINHYFPPIKVKVEKTDAELIAARVEADMKWMKDNGVSLDAYIATLQAKR